MSTPTGYRVQDPSTDQVVETFPALADGEVDQVLAAAERLLTVTGHAVELCPHSGTPGPDGPAAA